MRFSLSFLALAVLLLTACPPGPAAEPDAGAGKEESLAACKDGIDNDGDGFTDCADQDCLVFALCVIPPDAGSGRDASEAGSMDASQAGSMDASAASADAAGPVASFAYLGADPAQVPLGGSATVKFRALDSWGTPVARLPVVFSVAPGGMAIVENSGESVADGTVTTTLTAGAIAGIVVVTVLAADDNTILKKSDAIAISGGRINAKNLSLVCPHYSIGGFQKHGLEMECTAFGADFSGAFVPGSQVLLLTEAGAVPSSAAFSADPASGGIARFTYRTQCREPRDVPPLGEAAGDPGNPCTVMNPCKANPGIEVRTCNPRDGWATLVAISTGGESFQDLNGNLERDPGEAFVDLPEPFVDANDNGTRDNDPANDNVEEFYDANHNGKWDDRNGVWDAYTAIWTSVKITWTGEPTELILTPGNDSGTGAGGASPHCASLQYRGYLKDARGNPPTAASSTADRVKATCTSNCKVDKVSPYDDSEGLVDVTVSDAHSCPAPCTAPGCLPTAFAVDFSLSRTLDAKGTATMEDDLNPVIGPDPAPRTGLFE
ncbi:MAG TPA: hypothetical protein VGK67_08455 [Myxococcales bacterium]|jgi:hypothetical protein